MDDNFRNYIISTGSVAFFNVAGVAYFNQPRDVNDLPQNGNWIIFVRRYSDNYVIQEALGSDMTTKGNRFYRIVNRMNQSIFFDWV